MKNATAIVMCIFCVSVGDPVAAQRIGFEAEHMIESQMNARYLAFPFVRSNRETPQTRLQTGLSNISSSVFGTGKIMLGVEYYLPKNRHDGFLFSFFSDFMKFDNTSGNTTLSPKFIETVPFATPLNVKVTSTKGHAEHYGVTASVVETLSSSRVWQYGLALEYFDVGEFAVAFESTDPGVNISGIVNYAEIYTMLTPFVSLRQFFPAADSQFNYAAYVIGTLPMPRKGFSGRLQLPGFDQSGDTDSVGNGTHIPDPFIGVGFSIADAKNNWQIDIGASAYYFLTEGLIHRGIEKPLFINMTWAL